jgi:branched-chain amino acid transport system ATP-binding protein
MLLEASNIAMVFGGFRAVDGASLSVEAGGIIGLIGPNGAGKSTFFNCLAGDLLPTEGRIEFAGTEVTRATPEMHARLGMARTFQVPVTFEDMTVADNVMVGAFTGLDRLADSRAGSLGTPGRKRLEIARALATEPKLLLLDEALAGLTPAEIRTAIELVRRIAARGITIVIVEHIMEVILSLAERAVVFHQGKVIAEGAPREVVEDPAVVAAYLGHHMKRVRQ